MKKNREKKGYFPVKLEVLQLNDGEVFTSMEDETDPTVQDKYAIILFKGV